MTVKFAGVLAWGIGAIAMAQPEGPAAVVRLDSSLDAVLSPGAQLEVVHTDAAATFEGPTWIGGRGSGDLIFSVGPGNVLQKLAPDGTVTDFLGDIAAEDKSSTGANGTTLDRQGRVVYAGFSAGQIVRVETDGTRTVLADRLDGLRLNTPNDLVYRADGSLYFTDSVSKGVVRGGIPHTGLYRIAGGQLRLLVSTGVGRLNGLAFSPDQKTLYLGDVEGRRILRFDVQRDGTIANGTVFLDMSDTRQGPDGIKVDRKGNVYSTGEGGVWVVSPRGQHVGTIVTDKRATNLAFGGRDARMLYVTGVNFVARIPLKIAGIRP